MAVFKDSMTEASFKLRRMACNSRSDSAKGCCVIEAVF